MAKSPESLLLLRLFQELRRTELPLGIEEYQQLLRALQAGYGRQDRDDLRRLCEGLWVKTRDPGLLNLFKSRFEAIIPLSYGRPPEDEEETRPIQETTGQTTEQEDKTVSDTGKATAGSDIKIGDSQVGAAGQRTSTGDAAYASLDRIKATSGLEDEIQVAAMVQEDASQYYNFGGDYLPVSQRQMKQNWRYLRRASRFGPPVELDLEATIDQIAREGAFFHPVLRPRRINRTQLILLLDQDGSMVPFHSLSRRLAMTARRGGRLGEADIYYFHDFPIDHLFLDPFAREPMLIHRCLEQMHPIHSSVLIVSDAGAARGRYEQQRVQATQNFLKLLQGAVRNIAWLNPMPRVRWANSSAGAIARQVTMVEINPLGLQQAIKVLRGQQPHAQE